MDFDLTVRKNEEIDRLNKEERRYMAKIVQKIAKTGCNVLLIQKSIIRDAVNTLSLHFLAKKKIMVITDVERDDVEFIANSTGLRPISVIEEFVSEKLGFAESVSETRDDYGALIKITGVRSKSSAVSILLRGSNKLALDETKRSMNDALCVVRCLVKKPLTIPGGAAAEMEIATKMSAAAAESEGIEAMCLRAFANSMETIPFTLAENCGLNPIKIVAELRDRHRKGERRLGINARRGTITDMEAERVVQPVLVTLSAVLLATECVQMILKIDDIIVTMK